MQYFSDRERGGVPQTVTEITSVAWGGIAALIRVRLGDGSFGAQYPEMCYDGDAVPCGTSESLFWKAIIAEIPQLEVGSSILLEDDPPSLLDAMDMIEFCWRAVGKPIRRDYHSFFKHFHLVFNIEEGRTEFRESVNRIFQRNGLAFMLTEQGKIERVLPSEIGETLSRARFHTGDNDLDVMLETARRKFLDPDESMRREALEKLWDAWERIKTIENSDKKAGIEALLNRLASSKFRQVLETEARELTTIGNNFQIRHWETTQERLESSNHVDYLFYRMFSLLHLILRSTGRGG